MEHCLKGVKRVATSSNDAECSQAVRAENTAITEPDDDATTSSPTVSKTKKGSMMNHISISNLLVPTAHLSACYVAYYKLTAFKRKLDFWIIVFGEREIESFTSLSEFVNDNDSEMFQDGVIEEWVRCLTSMCASFEKYFPKEQNTRINLNS
ncbi:hypothetical protein HHI36_012878 [Cryptolaemus montrouzieri]|uniref:Uncharacterized protein n=1 Tax=Cryptolaemus montrouzieri TaxID=559131 RepID=A0ABD2NGC5_9CUCU